MLCSSGGTKVCLKKAIYGLKQSPRAWFKKFSITISVIGFHQYHSDHYVFVQRTKSDIVVLTVYLIFYWRVVIQLGYWRLRSILSFILWPRTWDIQNTFWELKLHIKNTEYFFTSESMLWIFLRKQVFWDVSLLPLQWKPMWIYDLMTIMLFDDLRRYKRLTGKLIYLTITRSDITLVVRVVSRFMY